MRISPDYTNVVPKHGIKRFQQTRWPHRFESVALTGHKSHVGFVLGTKRRNGQPLGWYMWKEPERKGLIFQRIGDRKNKSGANTNIKQTGGAFIVAEFRWPVPPPSLAYFLISETHYWKPISVYLRAVKFVFLSDRNRPFASLPTKSFWCVWCIKYSFNGIFTVPNILLKTQF